MRLLGLALLSILVQCVASAAQRGLEDACQTSADCGESLVCTCISFTRRRSLRAGKRHLSRQYEAADHAHQSLPGKQTHSFDLDGSEGR